MRCKHQNSFQLLNLLSDAIVYSPVQVEAYVLFCLCSVSLCVYLSLFILSKSSKYIKNNAFRRLSNRNERDNEVHISFSIKIWSLGLFILQILQFYVVQSVSVDRFIGTTIMVISGLFYQPSRGIMADIFCLLSSISWIGVLTQYLASGEGLKLSQYMHIEWLQSFYSFSSVAMVSNSYRKYPLFRSFAFSSLGLILVVMSWSALLPLWDAIDSVNRLPFMRPPHCIEVSKDEIYSVLSFARYFTEVPPRLEGVQEEWGLTSHRPILLGVMLILHVLTRMLILYSDIEVVSIKNNTKKELKKPSKDVYSGDLPEDAVQITEQDAFRLYENAIQVNSKKTE